MVNGLEVVPPQADSDNEIEDGLRQVLEADPLVHPEQIRITSRGSVVTLEGHVATEEQKKMAELDAWYLFGVDRVVNKLQLLR